MYMYIVTLHNSAQAVDTQRQPKYFLHLFIFFYQFLENIIQCVLIMLILSLSSSQPPDCVLLFFFFIKTHCV